LRKEYIIDGNSFDNLEGFYREIDRLLTKDLPWKTSNLDGFNDILRGEFGVHEYGEPILLRWINFEKSKNDFGYEATIRYYERLLLTCHPSNREHIKKQIADAKKRIGETLMDIITEIILDVDNTGHDCLLITDESTHLTK
jgi:RNAse (barnase) inhibitor barstar